MAVTSFIVFPLVLFPLLCVPARSAGRNGFPRRPQSGAEAIESRAMPDQKVRDKMLKNSLFFRQSVPLSEEQPMHNF
jgi:hypothetical protein